MKLIPVLIAILVASGCSTLKPIEMSPERLHERISTGEIIQVGDTVRIATADGENHKFEVTSITADHITGDGIEIPIADILAVQTREFSGGKTAALAGGAALLYAIVATVAAAAVVGL